MRVFLRRPPFHPLDIMNDQRERAGNHAFWGMILDPWTFLTFLDWRLFGFELGGVESFERLLPLTLWWTSAGFLSRVPALFGFRGVPDDRMRGGQTARKKRDWKSGGRTPD